MSLSVGQWSERGSFSGRSVLTGSSTTPLTGVGVSFSPLHCRGVVASFEMQTKQVSLGWASLNKFAQQIALGASGIQAYQSIRKVPPNSAAVSACRLLQRPNVQLMVKNHRDLLEQESKNQLLLSRDEILMAHTQTVLTPVGHVDENHWLAQEVKFKYATDEAGFPCLGIDGKPVVVEKTVKMLNKTTAMQEISRLQGYYKPEKLEISDTSNLKDQAAEALASDPSFAEMMREEARNMAAARPVAGRIIDLPPLGSMTLEDREEAAELDAAAEELLNERLTD